MIQITIGPSHAGSRLDRILRKRLPLMSLSLIFSLIRKGDIRVDGKKVKQNYRVQSDDCITIRANEAELAVPSGPDERLRSVVHTSFFKRNFHIIFEDKYILACNKPANLVVHPGTGHLNHDTLIDLATGYLLDKGCLGEGDEPALVHRLDRDTSGVILIAKEKQTARQLNEIFRGRTIEKEYCALTHNRPPEFEGDIVLAMAKAHEYTNGMKMQVKEKGMKTKSRYRIVEYNGKYSRCEVFLETGKTHQIRVHMAHIGAPIIGDIRYGDHTLDKDLFSKTGNQNRLYLHAKRISFTHPMTNKRCTLNAPLPCEFDVLMTQ